MYWQISLWKARVCCTMNLIGVVKLPGTPAQKPTQVWPIHNSAGIQNKCYRNTCISAAT